MSLLNFNQAKTCFGTKDKAVCYFILVESYEKHLDEQQKKEFLEANSIDDMLNVLDVNQLKYLKNLIKLIQKFKFIKFNNDKKPGYGSEAFSEWFTTNLLEYKESDFKDKDRDFKKKIYKLCAEIINKINSMEKVRKFVQEQHKEIIKNYKLNLSKFDGDSNEYRKWLILMCQNQDIIEISRSRDVSKILKNSSIKTLKVIKNYLQNMSIINLKNLIKESKRYEPYFYKFTVNLKRIPNSWNKTYYEINSLKYPKAINTESQGFKAFEFAKNNLVEQVKKILEEKIELFGNKIDKLKTSTKFYEDIYDMVHLMDSDVNENDLKRAIGEYSKVDSSGEVYNGFLRKAIFLEKFEKGYINNKKLFGTDIALFVNRIEKVRKYFLEHITRREYTVYRGSELIELFFLLKNSSFKIDIPNTYDDFEKDILNIMKEINDKKPVVFDNGLTSASLNKEIAERRFRGKNEGHLFFTLHVPAGSKALVLDYEGIENIRLEEEILFAERTKLKIKTMTTVNNHYEIEANVVE